MSNHVVIKYMYHFSPNNEPSLHVVQGETVTLKKHSIVFLIKFSQKMAN